MWMNDSDIDQAWDWYREHEVLGPAVKTLINLRDWANANSDGWHSWPKPSRAAAGLMDLVGGFRQYLDDRERKDATPEKFRAAMRAVKAFRTKQGAQFAIVALDYPRCDSAEDYAAWRKGQTGDVTFGDATAQFPMTDRGRLAKYMVGYRHQTRRTLCIGEGSLEKVGDDLLNAIDLASDQDQPTYLTNGEGKVIAAIVPAEQAERGEVRL